MSAHGSSTNDVSYNIDGATVNWPGGGGGATMLYYDQGMFEEVNYMTSAIPAEVMVGGVSINMVTKDAGNKWRGDARYSYASGCLQPTTPTGRAIPGCLRATTGRTTPDAAVHVPRKPDTDRRATSTSPAAARSSRIACGSTARSGAGSSTSWSTPRTPTARRRSTTTR